MKIVNFLKDFNCLASECSDSCCKQWSMQLDEITYKKYQNNPELLNAVDVSGEEAPLIMKRGEGDFCVKLVDGLCSIHKKYGAEMLGDACYFYPRITRKLGDSIFVTASISCPEIARLALFDGDFSYVDIKLDRTPELLTDYLPDEIKPDDAFNIHQKFVNSVDKAETPEIALMRIISVTASISMLNKESWATAIDFYLKNADSRLVEAESKPEDVFNLLHAIYGLMSATDHKKINNNLHITINKIFTILKTSADDSRIITSDDSYEAWLDAWQNFPHKIYNKIFKNWIKIELEMAFFPYAGFGNTIYERATIIAIRFATFRLALIAAYKINDSLDETEIIRTAQSIARFMDHLSDPILSLTIYEDAGWLRESRLCGLLKV